MYRIDRLITPTVRTPSGHVIKPFRVQLDLGTAKRIEEGHVEAHLVTPDDGLPRPLRRRFGKDAETDRRFAGCFSGWATVDEALSYPGLLDGIALLVADEASVSNITTYNFLAKSWVDGRTDAKPEPVRIPVRETFCFPFLIGWASSVEDSHPMLETLDTVKGEMVQGKINRQIDARFLAGYKGQDQMFGAPPTNQLTIVITICLPRVRGEQVRVVIRDMYPGPDIGPMRVGENPAINSDRIYVGRTFFPTVFASFPDTAGEPRMRGYAGYSAPAQGSSGMTRSNPLGQAGEQIDIDMEELPWIEGTFRKFEPARKRVIAKREKAREAAAEAERKRFLLE